MSAVSRASGVSAMGRVRAYRRLDNACGRGAVKGKNIGVRAGQLTGNVHLENSGFPLLSTARESHQHFMCDELVQLSKVVDIQKDPGLFIAEQYKSDDFRLEILVMSRTDNIEAIIGVFAFHECKIFPRRRHPEVISTSKTNLGLNRDPSMFIDPIQLVKLPERMRR